MIHAQTSQSTGSQTPGHSLRRLLQRLRRDSKGALTFVEIIIILAVVIAVIVVGARYFADKSSEAFTAAGDQVEELGSNFGASNTGTP